jgi:hypothetical protein
MRISRHERPIPALVAKYIKTRALTRLSIFNHDQKSHGNPFVL